MAWQRLIKAADDQSVLSLTSEFKWSGKFKAFSFTTGERKKLQIFLFFLSFACVEEEETSYFSLHNANQTVKNFETFKLKRNYVHLDPSENRTDRSAVQLNRGNSNFNKEKTVEERHNI